MNRKLLSYFVFLSLVALVGSGNPASAAQTPSPNRLAMCVRKTWAKTDTCKDPAVATKSAPKNLRNEIERLADLIVASFPKAQTEATAQTKRDKIEFSRIKSLLLADRNRADATWKNCLLRYGLKPESNNPRNYCFNEFLNAAGAQTNYSGTNSWVEARVTRGSGKYFNEWLSAWESIAILAHTFPQYIQPIELPTLLKAYDNIKACRAANNCRLP